MASGEPVYSYQADSLTFKGSLAGHGDRVTAITTSAADPDMIISASRDKKLIVWKLTSGAESVGYPKRILHGHNHFVTDVALSFDGNYAISSSWDKTLRLWDLQTGESVRRFVGHSADVLSLSFSPDNRQIVSGGRDRTVKVWNTVGEVKTDINQNGHKDWVSCVRVSPSSDNPLIVSASWDKTVMVWDLSGNLISNYYGHTGYVSTVTISPDGSLCASGGKDGVILLWDLNERKHLYALQAGDPVNSLVFSPNRYWLCAATGSAIKIFDLETKELVDEVKPDFEPVGKKSNEPEVTSLAWSADGSTLFAGYTDNLIRVFTANN